MEKATICIVGSGPAGVATAAALIKLQPGLREHLLVLEKHQHPRHKLCGGGLTPWVDELLCELELEARVPDFQVKRVRFYLNEDPLEFDFPGMLRTVRRDEFDAALADGLRRKGVRLLENTPVHGLRETREGVVLETAAGEFLAQIVVGADGAKSMVRRHFFREAISRVSRLIEVLVPAAGGGMQDFTSHTAVIDFRMVREGLQGYVWDFPCWVGGIPYLNVGLFDSRVYAGRHALRADLPALLQRHLAARGSAPDTAIMGHPERWYHTADCYSRPRVLLAGEAAGIEPWLGEGISAALAYGPIAAQAIIAALASGDLSFADYRERILAQRLGKFLRRNRLLARLFYDHRLQAALPLFGRVLHSYMWLKHRQKKKAARRLETVPAA